MSLLLAEPEIERVMLAHGGGGELTGRLVADHCLPHLTSPTLATLSDSAVVDWPASQVVFTTDSYVVEPLEFPGGDIGRLAVCGTVNDIAVMGAQPIALSLGLIIEEGLPMATLDRIMASIAVTAKEAGVEIVTGDTKVIERRMGDGLFINTAGIGRMLPGVALSLDRIEVGDIVIVSGRLAEHGLTVMSQRAGMEFDSDLRSDAAPLNGLIAEMLNAGLAIKFMRDATRGGVAGVLADISERTGRSLRIDETLLPISATARHAAEMLGFDPLTVANEGKIIVVVGQVDADCAVSIMRRHPFGTHAAVIGSVIDGTPPLVELRTTAGGDRIVQRPYGEELPRIC